MVLLVAIQDAAGYFLRMSAADWEALAERGYGAWSRGDLEGLLDALTTDVLFRPAGAFPGFADEYRGHEGMREFWAQIKEPWELFTIEALSIEPAQDDLALVEIRFHGVGRGSGVEVDLDFFHVVRRRDDRVAELHSHASRADALAAHGLRPQA